MTRLLGLGRLRDPALLDPWGNRIGYSVIKDLAKDSATFTSYSTALTNGVIQITDLNGNQIPDDKPETVIAYTLVSHGKDGKGAANRLGTIVNACNAAAKDGENCDNDVTFRDIDIQNSTVAANYYDDILRWKAMGWLGDTQNETFGDGFQIGAGFAGGCKGKDDGTVWCWGRNSEGQVGDGTTINRSIPVQVSGLQDVVDGDVNDFYSCALKSDGTLWCWGRNTWGELGDGTTTQRNTPVQVSGLTNVRQMVAGAGTVCALKADGTMWCWGRNTYGQVGDGTTTSPRLLPLQVTSIGNVVQMTVDELHTCVRKSDSTVWCWGHNGNGRLGDGTTIDRLVPVQVSGLTDVANVDAGESHVCAIKTDGTVWCWGQNTWGQLGDGTTTHRSTPVQVSGLTGVQQMEAGYGHNCAVKIDGTAWCWGLNWNGMLGDGTTTQRNTPVQVSGLTNVTAVGAGDLHSCAEKSTGTVWCWGHRLNGRLGDGIDNGANQLSPVQVLNFP